MAAAQCRSSKCTSERKGFRRELDSWRHKLIHCVGVESILEGIYGPMLLSDLNIFDDCEPKESDDWSVEASCSHCSFCTLPLDQLSDLPPAAASPLPSPSDYSPCQAPTLSESSQSAQQFLQAVFHKKDVPHGYDSNVPLAAQELMKRMIHKFAIEYASKSHVHMTMNGLTTDNLSPQPTPGDLDAPLDLTVPREKEEDGESEPDAVLDLSKRTSVCSAAPVTADNKSSGRQRRQREDYVDRSWELSEGLLSKALKDVRSGRLQEQRAALLYGIPQRTLRQGLEGWAEERLELLHRLAQQSSEEAEPFSPYSLTSSTLGGEACLVLQKVAAWAEKAENEREAEEPSDYHLPAAFCSGLQKTLSLCFPQLRDTLQPPASPTPSLEAPASLRIPQVRSTSDTRSAAAAADSTGVPEKQQHHSTSFAASTTNAVNPTTAARALFKLRPPYMQDISAGAASHSPLRLDLRRSSLDDSEECGDRRDKDKQPRKKRGRYRQYDHDLLEEAITMVMGGRMSVSKAQGVYGVPHSTLEYKVKERSGTLKNPPKKKSPIPCLFNSNSSGSGANARNAVSGTSASAAATKSLPLKEELGGPEKLMTEGGQVNENSALEKVLNSLCPAHRSLISQILMLARQEQLLSLPNAMLAGQDASKCCHHSLTSQNILPPCRFPLSNSKSLSGAPHYPLVDCAHQGCSKTLYSPVESKFSCTLRCCPLSESKASQGPCCCIESSYPVSCHENLHCTSCQHLTGQQTKNHCSSSSPSLCPSSQVCPAPSICCNRHCPVSCLCHSSHTCLAQTRQTMEEEGEDVDPPCPVLKREDSPSPPPLSPIPPDIASIAEEKPPLLPLYSHDEHLPLVDNQHLDARLQEAPSDIEDAAELNGVAAGGRTQKNSNRSLLRDVVDRFTEKLETIRPQDKDPPQLSSSMEHGIEKEGAPSSPSPQSMPFHADAHLSEIITTVLHTGSDSDYNLSELFHQHENKQAKSPNTRARRKQEVLPSLTLPANRASSRRNSLKIKRELAMLDPSYCRRKVPQAKKKKLKDGSNSSSPVSSLSDTTPVKEATRESGIQENDMVQISGKISVESGNFGDSSREIGRMTGKDKVTDHSRNDGLESPVFEQIRVEVNTIKAEEDGFEVKEDIQTIIVKEEIETIEVGQNVPAIEEEKASFQQTLKPPCKLQTKHCRVVSEGNYQSFAERHAIVGNHLENEENIEESDKRQTRSRGLGGQRQTIAPYQSSNSRDATRSKRNIVPPQRFSSYVTEPRKMYFVACFSENIFNPRTLVDSVGQSSTSIDSQSLDLMDPLLDLGKPPSQAAHSTEPTGAEDDLTPKVLTGSSNADQSQGFSVSLRPTRLSPSKYSSKNKTDVRDSAARPYGRLRSSSTKPHALESVTVCRTPTPKSSPSFSDVDIPPNPSELPFEFSSPIKIMYVSPVINEEGVKYCLKSAASSGQVVHNFDPCEQSSWAGTPETSHGTERAIFQIGSNSAPLKNATFSPKSASPSPKKVSTPLKSPSTPPLSGSPTLRSASSPTKVVSVSPKGSRRSGELTPLKRVARTENQRSPADLGSSHEITPPKRRPGRPKKLGPRLEQKAKRPIGRPRKQTTTGPKQEGNADVVKAIEGANMQKENKNLKITVVYGRSRRNKRVVSEGQGQQELCETAQSVERNIDFRNLLHGTQEHSDVKAASPECLKELNLVRPVNYESAPPASSNIKCQKLQGAVSIRKPGRPAKVKISGISVTVTTVSPRQRKIQMDKDVKRSQETLQRRKTLLPEFKYIKETWNIDCPSRNECRHKEGKGVTKDEGKGKRLDRPVAVRHSVRVRKPSIYLLHSVATSSSRSYSHSTALIRSSRKLLLNKAINQRKLEKAQDCLENLKDKRQSLGREKNPIRQDLSQVAAVSVDSIFPPQETMKWWAASAEKKDLNQEFARRIQLVSDTWVSDIDNQQKCSLKPRSGPPTKRSRCSSVVRALFDCPPNKPSSCSMQQLGSWFMQTTETKPLAIVKKASSRNPYEFMHYPRSTNNEGVCPSPQAERLRKHIKKFAKTVPKSPLAHRLALERLRNRNKTLSAGNIKRQLFTSRFAPGRLNKGAPRWMGRTKYATTLSRAKARFLTCLQRNGLPKRQRKDWWPSVTAQKQRDKALSRLSPDHQALDGSEKGPADPLPKEDSLSSKAWSPEKLKECRVFLKKINSPGSESTAEEELDSCTVTLDDWCPSAYRFAGSEGGLARENEAVKTERKAKLKAGSNSDESSSSVSKSPQEQAEVQTGQKEEQNAPVIVSTGAPQPPSVKMLRQSRVRGLSGPRWSDFVLEN